ncbi:MAG: ORF6N domain-containing protein [Peptostreptococcaceae bacterium]|nr:ORF6N domain-containing protein [Peptostreptococcaceae bacterium]
MKGGKTLIPVDETNITNLIYTIRGKQVMLDSDLAALYQVETKYLNRQRSRNADRFPEDFCFQLTKEEYEILRCQNVTSKNEKGSGGRRYMPYMFTEQGIAMLSSVLKSDVATKVSINIMRAFVEMRKFVLSNREMFARLDRVELKQLETDKKLEEVFNYIASNAEIKQKIFFDGQIYDAFSFIADLIGKAQSKLILIDNYVDVNTLNMLCKKNSGVDVLIATAGKGSLTTKDINKFNAQYPSLSVKTTADFHDRFLIIDDTEGYFIGASIKDAGKKSFAITKIEDGKMIHDLINKVS